MNSGTAAATKDRRQVAALSCEARDNESPELVNPDGARKEHAKEDRNLNHEVERTGNAVKVQRGSAALFFVEILDRLDQRFQERLVDDEAHHGSQNDADCSLEEPVLQLLEMIKERHPGFGVGLAPLRLYHFLL
jgi:hypothetical protein